MGFRYSPVDLTAALGFGPMELSLCYLVGTVGSALILTPSSKLLDRWGARKMGTAVLLLLGVHLLALSWVDRGAAVLRRFLPGGLTAAFLLMTLGFLLLRFLGQGLLPLVSRTMAMKWFNRHRGRANAIRGSFISFGFSSAPRFFNSLRGKYGWNGAWRLLGILLSTVFAAIFWLIARDNPRECGLVPDGEGVKKETSRPSPSPQRDFTLEEARRTMAFWIFTLSLALHALFITAMTFHIVAIFEEAGMDRSQAVSLFLPASFISVAVNFTASWLSDYVKMRSLLQCQLVAMGIPMFLLASLFSEASLIPLTLGYGAMSGFFTVSTFLVWPRYFGTTHLGSIMGMVMGFMVGGSAVGPGLFSLFQTLTGSFSGASLACLSLTAVLLGASCFTRRPTNPTLHHPQKS